MKRYLSILSILAVSAAPGALVRGQQISGTVEKNAGKASIAIPDLRGAGEAQTFMNTVNATLFSEVQNSGIFRMVPKTVLPLQIPQQPSDFKRAPEPGAKGNGYYLSDWSGPPANSTYLAFGYTAAQNGQIVLRSLAEFARDGGAVLLVTHDPGAGEHASRIVKMDGGKIR